jgi:hypothetical protein
MSKRIPNTNNREWGFFGTMTRAHNESVATTTWQVAGGALVATLGVTPEVAQTILDSTVGRHLADQVSHLASDLVAMNKRLSEVVNRSGWRRSIALVLKGTK